MGIRDFVLTQVAKLKSKTITNFFSAILRISKDEALNYAMNKGDYKAIEQLGYLVENKKPIKELIDWVTNLEKKGELIFKKRLDTINYVLNDKTIETKEIKEIDDIISLKKKFNEGLFSAAKKADSKEMKKYIDLGANVNYLSLDNNMSIIETLLNTQFKHIIENNTNLQSDIDLKNLNSERSNIEKFDENPCIKLLTENGLDTSQCTLRQEKIQYYLETQSQPTQADFTKFIIDKISKYASKRNNENNIFDTSNLDSKSIESGYSSNQSETDENIHGKPHNTLSDTTVENIVEEVEITRL